jgi:hypothetical protein
MLVMFLASDFIQGGYLAFFDASGVKFVEMCESSDARDELPTESGT